MPIWSLEGTPPPPPSHSTMPFARKLRTVPVAVWPAAMVLAVAALAISVSAGADVVHLDVLANHAVHSHAAEPVTGWVFVVTTLGATPVLIAVVLSAAAGLAIRGRWRSAVALVLAYSVTDMTVAVVKHLVSRPRPDESLTHASGFSFPSGHSALSMAVYGCLAFALARSARGAGRVALAAGGAAIVVAIGLSRVYLGVHYPTDVLAGWLTGAAILIAAWAVAVRLRPAANAG